MQVLSPSSAYRPQTMVQSPLQFGNYDHNSAAARDAHRESDQYLAQQRLGVLPSYYTHKPHTLRASRVQELNEQYTGKTPEERAKFLHSILAKQPSSFHPNPETEWATARFLQLVLTTEPKIWLKQLSSLLKGKPGAAQQYMGLAIMQGVLDAYRQEALDVGGLARPQLFEYQRPTRQTLRYMEQDQQQVHITPTLLVILPICNRVAPCANMVIARDRNTVTEAGYTLEHVFNNQLHKPGDHVLLNTNHGPRMLILDSPLVTRVNGKTVTVPRPQVLNLEGLRKLAQQKGGLTAAAKRTDQALAELEQQERIRRLFALNH